MAKSTGESSIKCFTVCTKNMLSPIAKVHAHEPFPFDRAFAMTVHEAQRRTIKQIVVDLMHHPRCCCCMKSAAIFVAMSRVDKRSNVVDHACNVILSDKWSSLLHRSINYDLLHASRVAHV